MASVWKITCDLAHLGGKRHQKDYILVKMRQQCHLYTSRTVSIKESTCVGGKQSSLLPSIEQVKPIGYLLSYNLTMNLTRFYSLSSFGGLVQIISVSVVLSKILVPLPPSDFPNFLSFLHSTVSLTQLQYLFVFIMGKFQTYQKEEMMIQWTTICSLPTLNSY